jgi:mannose/fructose/N-acetylgalactosamine-specific phosphotransferase system component IIC
LGTLDTTIVLGTLDTTIVLGTLDTTIVLGTLDTTIVLGTDRINGDNERTSGAGGVRPAPLTE